MATTLWTPKEEAALLATLPAGAVLRREYYVEFLESCPSRRDNCSFNAWRCKARALRSEPGAAHLPTDSAAVEREEVWREQRRIILRENARLQSERGRLLATNELIIEAMEEAVARLPTFEPPKPHVVKSGKKRRPQVAMLDLSDVHGGEVVRPEDVAGLGGYNFDLCKTYMDRLTEAVLSICDVYQTAGIGLPKLVINFLGDIVTNEDVYLGQGRDIDRNLVDQIFQLSSELCHRVLYPLAQYFPEVQANAVWGNHGRFGKKGQYHPRTNGDYILYHALRLMMDHVEHFNMRISLSSFMGFVLPEDPTRPHLIVHGDQVKSYMQIPFYGLSRYERRMVGLTRVHWAYTHLGHFHSSAKIDGPHGERLMNGSWPGGSDYSINKLQAGNQPKQTFIGLHSEHGKTFQYDIYLSKDRPKLTLGEDGLYTPIWHEDVETRLR